MKHNSTKQIKLGMLLSYLNLGIGNLIPFFYTPVMLELLGQSEYGLYKIASSTTSYLSLMAFGIGSAVSRFIIKARTQDGKEAEERMFGLFNLLFQAVALLTLIVGGIITWKLDLIYGASLTSAELNRMRILVGLMVISTAVGFSATSYNAVVFSHERFLFIHSVNILTTIGTPILNLVILFMGYRSVGMAVLSLSLNIIVRLVYIAFVRKALDIRPRYKGMPTHAIREIFAFSFWVFVGTLAGQLYDATDTVIIGANPAYAATGAAVYSIGTMFPHIISNLGQVIPGFWGPRVNTMIFSGESNEKLSDVVISVGRVQSFIVALVVSGFIAFGQPFILWYAGEEYRISYWIAIIIIIPNCIPLIQSVALAILRAKNMHRFRSILYMGIACVNFIGTLLLIKPLGLIGASIPTGLALLIGNGLIINIYYWKKVGLDIPKFWKNVLPIFGMAACLSCITLLLGIIVDFTNPLMLCLGILFYTCIYCILIWFFAMTSEEKRNLVDMFFSRNSNKE